MADSLQDVFNISCDLCGYLYAPLFTFNFFGELDPVRVCEWAGLLVDVVNVQHFTHELDNWLGLVESCGRDCRMKQRHELVHTMTYRTTTSGKYTEILHQPFEFHLKSLRKLLLNEEQ